MLTRVRLLLACFAFAAATTVALPLSANAAPGSIIMARGGPSPLFIWDASDVVAAAVSAHRDVDPTLHAIEGDALQALATKLQPKQLPQAATILVIYAKNAKVSPAYGTATMASVERLMTIALTRDALAAPKIASEASQLRNGQTTGGVKVTITGKLPPMK